MSDNLCLKNCFNQPSTEKHPWCEFAENAETGASAEFLKTVNLINVFADLKKLIVCVLVCQEVQHGDCVSDSRAR